MTRKTYWIEASPLFRFPRAGEGSFGRGLAHSASSILTLLIFRVIEPASLGIPSVAFNEISARCISNFPEILPSSQTSRNRKGLSVLSEVRTPLLVEMPAPLRNLPGTQRPSMVMKAQVSTPPSWSCHQTWNL